MNTPVMICTMTYIPNGVIKRGYGIGPVWKGHRIPYIAAILNVGNTVRLSPTTTVYIQQSG